MSVTIEDSYGKQTKIKVTPSTTMKEVVQEYCKQKNIESTSATLLHNRKPLDLSLPFRLTGLQNNAKLMVGRRANDVVPLCTIALQLADGSRVQDRFQTDYSLWQVLLGFEEAGVKSGKVLNLTKLMEAQAPSDEKRTGLARLSKAKPGPIGWMQPVLTLLNKRFDSIAELNSTTLQFLGASGSCLIRVTFVWTSETEPPTVEAQAAVATPKVVAASSSSSSSLSSKETKSNGNDNNGEVRPIKTQKTTEESPLTTDADDSGAVVDAVVPEDRNGVVFEPTESPFNAANFEVPDDFYNLGAQDLALLKTIAGKPDEPLMTREFREKKQIAAYSKFSKTNIRVRFPNRWELQGTFLASEGTMDLIEFVGKYLSTEEREFVLYTTPPKQNLSNSSFIAQKLMPAAVVYFAWSDQMTDSGPSEYLSAEAMASAAAFGADNQHLTTFSSQKPLDYHAAAASGSGDKGKGKEEAVAKPKKKGVPSWLKLGK